MSDSDMHYVRNNHDAGTKGNVFYWHKFGAKDHSFANQVVTR